MTSVIERDDHLARSAAKVQQSLRQQQTLHPTTHVDLVVLPELSSIDYSREAFERLDVLAEEDDGPSFQTWREVAKNHQCFVLYGFARRIDNGNGSGNGAGHRIATAAVSPEGSLVGIYDKLHLAQFGDSMEKEYFDSRGEQLLVFDVNGFRVAPIICYDIRMPELCRTLALEHRVDLITHVGAYARDRSFYSWHAFATTRAVENQLYFLSLNRAGEHFGHSVFCPPWIDEKNTPETFDEHVEECRVFTLTRKTIDAARRDYTFLDDRLPDYALPVNSSGN